MPRRRKMPLPPRPCVATTDEVRGFNDEAKKGELPLLRLSRDYPELHAQVWGRQMALLSRSGNSGRK